MSPSKPMGRATRGTFAGPGNPLCARPRRRVQLRGADGPRGDHPPLQPGPDQGAQSGPSTGASAPPPDTWCVTGRGHAHRPHLRGVRPRGRRKGRLRAECPHCSHPGECPRVPGRAAREAGPWLRSSSACPRCQVCRPLKRGDLRGHSGRQLRRSRCVRRGRRASARSPRAAKGAGPRPWGLQLPGAWLWVENTQGGVSNAGIHTRPYVCNRNGQNIRS